MKTLVRVCFALFLLTLVGLFAASHINKRPIPLDGKLQAIADRIKQQDEQAKDPAVNGLLVIKDDLYMRRDAPPEEREKLDEKWAPRLKISDKSNGAELGAYRRWEKENPAELEQTMAAFAKLNLPILQEMAAKPKFIFDSNACDPRSPSPNFIMIRALAQAVSMYALYQSEHGKVGEAVLLLATQLRMQAGIGQDGILITLMISNACENILLDQLQPMLLDPRLTEADLAPCAEALATVPNDWTRLKNAADAEELSFHNGVSLVRSGERFSADLDPEQGALLFGLMRATPVLMADYRFGRSCYEKIQKTVEDPKNFAPMIEEPDAFTAMPAKLYLMSQMMIPNIARSAAHFRTTATRVSAAQLTCALQRYHLKTRKYPERLEQLVPQYLSELPKSYTNTQLAFTYAPEGASFKLSTPVEDNEVLKTTLFPNWGPEGSTSLQLVPPPAR